MDKITLTREDRRFAAKVFARYKSKVGSEHIASKVALAYLTACLRQFKPKVAVECGAGIGTMTDALLTHPCGLAHVFALEPNAFCRSALAENLSHHDASRITVIGKDKNLKGIEFPSIDFLVADGGFARKRLYEMVKEGSVVFVEGSRGVFRTEMQQTLRERGLAIEFVEYGYHIPLLSRLPRRWQQRLPSRIRPKKQRIKGCWVGQVQWLP